MRNREIRRLIIVLVIMTLFGMIMIAFISKLAALILLLVTGMMTAAFFYVLHWRNREIKRLSGYLRQIHTGDFDLDLRDNYEGELSILKSEIYKVTRMLSEQRGLLKKDKIHLQKAMSDISHQLKTPLASMTVMSDLLEDPNLPAERRTEFVHNVQNQLERMEWLVTSLLKLSKIDAGTVYFKQDNVNVHALIDKALEPLRESIEDKHIQLSVQGDGSTSFTGDFRWSSEALVNVIKNCVEHLHVGRSLQIAFSKNSLYTEITIHDNGSGIAKEDLPYIFKRFYKGKNASDDSVGIGLAMAHTIIMEQNGSLDVKSIQGEGTTFIIKFFRPLSES